MTQKRRSKVVTKPKRKKAPKRNRVMKAAGGRYRLTGFDAEMERLITALRKAGQSQLAEELDKDKGAFKSRDPEQIKRLLENLKFIINTTTPLLRMLAVKALIDFIKDNFLSS